MFLRWLIGVPKKRRVLVPPPVVTTIPCTHGHDGEIVVSVPDDARPPVFVHWRGIDDAQVSFDTLRATGLSPGWYSLHLEDASGVASGAVNVKVESRELPLIKAYTVSDASADDMSDGSVEAVCDHVGDECLLMWSNGARTTGRTLAGVRPGTYSAWVVKVDGENTSCVHTCLPACVGVQ